MSPNRIQPAGLRTIARLHQDALGLVAGLRRSGLVDGTHPELVLEPLGEVRHTTLALGAGDIHGLLPLGAAMEGTNW